MKYKTKRKTHKKTHKKTLKFVQFRKKIFQKRVKRKQIFVKPCITTLTHKRCSTRGKCNHQIIARHNLCSNKTK